MATADHLPTIILFHQPHLVHPTALLTAQAVLPAAPAAVAVVVVHQPEDFKRDDPNTTRCTNRIVIYQQGGLCLLPDDVCLITSKFVYEKNFTAR